ncbi:hypothetical protein PLICRDRAFT_50698 [Plicaturopsis crispa FD-325 SS-3]|nr:hypothetical protein PLICRDRAFT_50698 [Plicaturopsis crispa FD-325 SS-3]
MEYIDTPPPYSAPSAQEESSSSPMYSPHPMTSERVLHSLPRSHLHRVGSGSADPDFVFRTEHMELNLGPRAFSAHIPAFGWNGAVSGHAKFFGNPKNVVKVTVALKGDITTTVADPGTVASYSVTRLLCETITLYPPSSQTFEWDGVQTFTIPFPTKVTIKQGTVDLPPSHNAFLPATTCNVSYTLQVDMTRKGLRRHESLNIPVLYLPKSRPSHPPLLDMPPLPALFNADAPLPIDDHTKTIRISGSWSDTSRASKPSGASDPALYLALPSPACFTSGDDIPLLICLIAPGDAILARLLRPAIRVTLLKRTRVWFPGDGSFSRMRDVPIASVNAWTAYESAGGAAARIKCKLKAGSAGQENSWGVEGNIDVQYFVRVVLTPPASVADRVPIFRHKEPVKIMTDPFGQYERELLSTGGVPTPALGIAAPHLTGDSRRRSTPAASADMVSTFSRLSAYR